LTGFTAFEGALSGKWLGLLKTIVPQLAHVGLLFNPNTAPFAPFLRAAQEASAQFAVKIEAAQVRSEVYYDRFFIEGGGLMSYGPIEMLQYEYGATYVDRILRGSATRDLPVQFVTKFQSIINLKTAKALGLTIPETLLATADEVIQ
jgi:putative ABC transport system substrate-binding protein